MAEEPRALELEAVWARHPGSAGWALSGVSLTVRPGEIVAILGPNGAGKSTLLRVAAALLPVARGAVRCFERDVRGTPGAALARAVALVAQSETPASGFSVREVVAMGRAPHQGRWMREQETDRAAVAHALARCDLSGVAERPVQTLSGGEQRRVALARALAQEPRLLLLDEPAAFFDVRHRLELASLIDDLAAKEGLAALVAMHDLDEASRLASGVVLLRDGRVVASGATAAVMTTTNLRETFGVSLQVGVHTASGQTYFLPELTARAERGARARPLR